MVISIETDATDTDTSSVPLASTAVCVLLQRSGFVTWRFCNNSVFEILVSLRYNKWLEDALACKLLTLIS